MKLSKKKVFALALAVCLIATLSFGSLAWFTDNDSVTNDFMIAGSDDEKPDDIFSVDVWEDKDGDGQRDDDDPSADGEGLDYEDILPGDILTKVAHVKNTGSYEQYIRVKITVSDAKVWQDIYKANMVPVTEFVDVELSEVYNGMVGSYLEGDNFVYYLYYNEPLAADDPETTDVDEADDIVIFNKVTIPTHMTQQQAAPFAGGFQVSVHADAVQTKNVGENVYEAFQTVGMEIPVNTKWVEKKPELLNAINNGVDYIVLGNNIDLWNDTVSASDLEVYLNGYTLKTSRVTTDYGVKVDGALTISGTGTVNVAGNGVMVESLNHLGGTISGAGKIVDSTDTTLWPLVP